MSAEDMVALSDIYRSHVASVALDLARSDWWLWQASLFFLLARFLDYSWGKQLSKSGLPTTQ
jgi:hypothetical protein